MSREKLEPMSKERFDELKTALEAKGYKVKNRWRKGTTSLHLEDIVLSKSAPLQTSKDKEK